VLTHLWYAGLSATGLVALTRRLRRGAVILGYHNVVSRPSEAMQADPSLHATREHFEAQIRWLKEHCDVVSLAELASRLDRDESVSGTAAITFDDGYAGVVEHAWPILRALGVPATVFIIADAPGNIPVFWWDTPAIARAARRERDLWLLEMRGDQRQIVPQDAAPVVPRALRLASWEMLGAAVREGLDIGCHSASHRTMTRLTDLELRDEIERSRDTIRERLRVTPQWFSYPYGMWDLRVRDRVRAAGYQGAVTLDRGLNTRTTDRWAFRRINIPASISLPAFDAWSVGLTPSASAAQ
jgi:peptidoglycan/xylan/chitin deacetylase (PgdA/CDA1 family)